MKRFHLSLGLRVALSTAAATAAILIALGAWEYRNTARTLDSNLNAVLAQVSARLALNLNEPLYALSTTQVASVVTSEMLAAEVVYIAVADSPEPDKGVVRYFVHQDDGTVKEQATFTPPANLLKNSALVMHGEEKIGRFELGLGYFTKEAALRNLRFAVAIRTGACALVILGSLLVILRVQLIRPVRGLVTGVEIAIEQARAASREVADASFAFASGSTQQSGALEQVSASLGQLSGMTNRNAQHATNGKTSAADARHAAEAGATEMIKMQDAMNAIQQSSGQISKIIKTIDEIAFQTNILALNAAVEAARAGEAGAGFAVVADEVRSLAQRSALAARETAEKIEDANQRSALGVKISGRVSEHFSAILTKVRDVDTIVTDVAAASHAQNEGLSNINSSLMEMDKATKGIAATAEETASTTEQLNAQTEAISQASTRLSALVS
ncbi:MAG: methyl-accepting chemotaxis protein [bacterium]